MSKKDEAALRAQLQGDRSRILSEGSAYGGKATSRADELYPQVTGGYQQFAQTGGYSPEDIANIRSRATSAVPAVYDRLKENLRRRSALTGGYQPGMGANLASMGRGMAQTAAENTRDTELGIGQAVRENKMRGLAGLGGLYGEQNQSILANRGLTNQGIASIYGAQLPLATRPGPFSNIMRGIGTVAGALSPFGGGPAATPPSGANYDYNAQFNAGLMG